MLPTFTGRYLLNIIQFAAHQGAAAEKLFQITGKTEAELCDESSRLPSEVYNAVLETAVSETKDPYLGLHIGESLNLTAVGLLGQIVQTSRTVGEAIGYMCEFASLGCSAMPVSMREGQNLEILLNPHPVWAKSSEVAVRHTADAVLVFSVREFQALLQEKRAPLAVEFAFPPPPNQAEYERLFGCPVHFGREETVLQLPLSIKDRAIQTSDYALLQVLVQYAQVRMQELEGENGFSQTVQKTIASLMKPEFPTLETVAAHLNLTGRTLQRKLKEEGHTFRGLVETTRRELAENYLRNPDLSIKEVAWLLNYADSSVFVRSFKRWTGDSPSQWRR